MTLRLHRRHLLATAAAIATLPGLSASARSAEVAPSQRRTRFNDGWRFSFGHLNDVTKDFGFGADLRTFAKQGWDATPAGKDDFDDSKWREVNLPHDWAVELPFVPNPKFANPKPEDWDPAANHGFKPLGREFPETSVGWYRKTFKLDAADKAKRISLEFDGVFRSTIVMINNYIVKQHEGGYGPFRVEINDFLNTDDKPNIILVRVDASLGEGWFYEGAGIYRHVWLVKTDPVHVPQYGVLVRATIDGLVDITATLRNDTDQDREIKADFTVSNQKQGAEYFKIVGMMSTAVVKAHASEDVTIRLQIPADHLHLWSLEDTYLYGVETRLSEAGSLLDTVTTRFGVRDIKFDPDNGFFLNGKPVKLLGTCNHQDHAGIGAALPDAIQYYRLRCLKEMGCNAYRTSHNPPTPELLDACDELGILVIDETRMMTSSDQGLDDLQTMILRDRNHPSVILWSIGNEEPQQGTDRGAKIARTMKRLVNRLDPTRLVTAAMDSGFGDGITSVIDVMGFNYRDNKIDDFHAKFPKMPIIGTETGSTVCTRGEYVDDSVAHIVPAYDTTAPWWANTAEQWWPHFDAKPYIAGGFIWTGFDYRGEPTPYSNWPSISSQFGVLDTCGFPKDNYYYYRAWWRSEPLLHLFPHWNWEGKEGQEISVWAYGNVDEVELFVNGKSAGKKPMPRNMHVDWKVVYAPGKIEAFGYKNGKVILKDKRETAGPAAKIVVTADRTSLRADGMDCAVLRAEVFDAKGRPVPKADNLVVFEVSGIAAVIGVGNGNPNSHEPDKAIQRKAFNGLCSAIVQIGKSAGSVIVSATSDGLKPGKVVLKLT